ncbi:RNA pseudouridine synthase [Coraliomargarita sinensis]|uniref:RNA pseudouridine synthase n=1 Tax=Coraliomargarita sinensis TaxID=2174842 RepID=A0A317ZEG0_9BACT|nr:RluA family pseudouridine synthase [Coraliomargarita sinensis]PXA03815.1 RNA pseudouridine synthase [Coraliomargarita sinensis]
MSSQDTAQPDELPLNKGVHLLAANEDGLVALEKPFGAMSHPNKATDIKRSMIQASYDYENEYFFWETEEGVERKVWLINRLDSPTSGVILVGLNPEIAAIIKQEFSTHKVTKNYHALVRHKPHKHAGIWADVISKDLVNNGRKIKKGRQIKAKSGYQLVKTPVGGFPIALLKLVPVTGRTHQLRIQCSKHGHPIVGDRSYGNFRFNKEVVLETGEKRMMLHASECIVNYTYKGKAKTFRAHSELPEAFQAVLGFRPGMGKPRPTENQSEKQDSANLKGRRFKAV